MGIISALDQPMEMGTDNSHGFIGIPAITMSASGSSSGIHSAKNEWWAPVNAHVGPQNVLLAIPGQAGIRDVQPSLLNVAAQAAIFGVSTWTLEGRQFSKDKLLVELIR